MSVKSKVDVKGKSKQRNVKIDSETSDKLSYICNTLNQKHNRFLNELIDQLFNIVGTFEKANVSYFQSVSGSYVMVQFTGKNRLIFGSNTDFNDSPLDKEIKEKLVG